MVIAFNMRTWFFSAVVLLFLHDPPTAVVEYIINYCINSNINQKERKITCCNKGPAVG
jgi:hypothetical protein